MQLEKVREAAERVARSLGLEIFDVEWKVGKQRCCVSTLTGCPARRIRKAWVSLTRIASGSASS